MTTNPYTWTDNAMKKGVAVANPDNADQNLQYLKWRLDNFSGGVSTFNNLGTVSANFALEADKITRVDITGNYKPILPTPSDSSKRVTCILEFTTTNAAYPLLTSLTNLKWKNSNGGNAPSAYSRLSGVMNVLIFQSCYISGTLYWEVEYTTYGAVESTFIQPTLSADGTLGGSTFAVWCSTGVYNNLWAYQGADNNDGTRFLGNGTVISHVWYNPIPIKAQGIYIKNWNDGQTIPTAYSLYGSNDNSNYVTLMAGQTNSNLVASSTWDAAITSSVQGFYKYLKMYSTNCNSGGNTGWMQATVHGTIINT